MLKDGHEVGIVVFSIRTYHHFFIRILTYPKTKGQELKIDIIEPIHKVREILSKRYFIYNVSVDEILFYS